VLLASPTTLLDLPPSPTRRFPISPRRPQTPRAAPARPAIPPPRTDAAAAVSARREALVPSSSLGPSPPVRSGPRYAWRPARPARSEAHTSELQSLPHL